MTTEAIEAVVLDETKPALCGDCDGLIRLSRLQVTAPKRCAGMKLWSIPTHTDGLGTPCPARSWRAVD